MQKIIIAAVSNNNAIGLNDKLIFNIKEDMEFFKRMTSGNAVIMGRKTYEAIGRSLPDRVNIVITRNLDFKKINEKDDIVVVDSLEMAYALAEMTYHKKVYVIGGGEIYSQAVENIDVMLLTVVNTEVEGADTFFPTVKYDDWNIEKIGDLTEDAAVYQFTPKR